MPFDKSLENGDVSNCLENVSEAEGELRCKEWVAND